MIIECLYNDPFDLPIEAPNDFDFGLEVGKKYLVMGIAHKNAGDGIYFLVDDAGRPGWFPKQLFRIVQNTLPISWFCQDFPTIDSRYDLIIGFQELCKKTDFVNKLLLREKDALSIYFKRKLEIEGSMW